MSPSSRIELQRTDDGLLVLLDGERERQEVVQRTLRGLGGLRFHDLRHTHATLLLQAGVPVAAVSARLGHANAAVTLGIYSHTITDAEAAAARVAGSLLSEVLQSG
jgi:integrase